MSLFFWRRPNRSRLIFRRSLALFFTLTGLAAALALITISLELRQRALLPVSIPMLAEFSLDPITQKITLTRAQRLAETDTQPDSSKLDLQFISQVQGENFDLLLNSDSSHMVDPRYFLTKPVAVTRIQYAPGTKLNFHGSGSIPPQDIPTQTAQTAALAPIPARLNIQTLEDNPLPPDQTAFKLLYLSSAYPDPNQFKTDAGEMDQFLRTVPPFNRYSSRIQSQVRYTSSNLGCSPSNSMPRLILCDLYLIHQAAADLDYDSIIVIYNSNDYGGGGYLGLNVAVTYRDTSALAKQVMVHEFGHSFGGLMDEYSYGSSWPSASAPWPNCDVSPCFKWLGVPATACHSICGYSNLSRPTYNDSLMRTLFPDTGFHFSPESVYHLTALLAQITGYHEPLTDVDLDGDTDYFDHLIPILQYDRPGSADNNLSGIVNLYDIYFMQP